MPRDPRFTAADAAQFLRLIEADDAAATPLVLGPSDDPRIALEGAVAGTLAGADFLDFVPVVLDRTGLYSFLAVADGPVPLIDIFDDEGYLLLSTDAARLGIEPARADTILQFLPDYSGTHHLLVTFEDPASAGAWGLGVEAVFGATDAATGNTAPLARDAALTTAPFRTTRVAPADAAFDADGDALAVVGIAEQPAGGIAFVSDGAILYRSSRTFAGADSFDYVVSDGRGGTDTGRVFVQVAPETGSGATVADAQIVAYLYEAGLDRDGAIDLGGLNFWIDVLEGGTRLDRIAEAFLVSNEFTAAYGAIDSLDDAAFVRKLYGNVLDREGEPGGVAFWTAQLAAGASRAQVLVAFAGSAENLIGSPRVADMVEGPEGDWTFA